MKLIYFEEAYDALNFKAFSKSVALNSRPYIKLAKEGLILSSSVTEFADVCSVHNSRKKPAIHL